jgi:hypothetical protein
MKLTESKLRTLIQEELEKSLDEIAPALAAGAKMVAGAAGKAAVKQGVRSASDFLKSRKSQSQVQSGTTPDEMQMLSNLDQALQNYAKKGNLASGQVGILIQKLQALLTPKEG